MESIIISIPYFYEGAFKDRIQNIIIDSRLRLLRLSERLCAINYLTMAKIGATRHEFVAHSGMICNGNHDDGVFHQIIGLKSIEEIEVCVTGCSRDAVLDELETG
ncbi:MAG: hypothetical protein KAU46_05840 [Candidatus Aminicenantes bacterium]|nr:hypothetical protein [Candidatus Aminicenantes bacterium]